MKWAAIACLTLAAAAPAAAEVPMVPSTGLLERMVAYDNATVIYEGEAIRDVMRRGDHAWVNVHDGSNALGVWLPLAMLPPDLVTGQWSRTGDILRVEAVFHADCDAHGGEVDLHAIAVTRVARAEAREHPVSPGRWVATLVAVAAALALAGLGARVERRRAARG